MQNETFRKIVSTKTYECEIKNIGGLPEILRQQNRPEKSGGAAYNVNLGTVDGVAPKS